MEVFTPIHHSVPAIANFYGDESLEVVISSWLGVVYLIETKNMSLVWNENAFVDVRPLNFPNAYGSVSAADVNSDGVLDILLGTDQGVLFFFKSDTGEGYGIDVVKKIRGTPAIADLDGDGKFEIVVGAHDNGASASGKLLSLSSENGGIEWQNEFSPTSSSAAIADIDGDGVLEIVIGNEDGNIYCFDGKTGALEWNIRLAT